MNRLMVGMLILALAALGVRGALKRVRKVCAHCGSGLARCHHQDLTDALDEGVVADVIG
jgi:hypothetical protein